MKKVVVIGIIILFLLTGFSSISGIQLNENIIIPSYKGNTLYVGGSGEGNYTSIQDAVDNASDGDTVFVFDDSSPYYENLVIDKPINLIGEDKNTTVIDAQKNGTPIKIADNDIKVVGFTIKNMEDRIGREWNFAVIKIKRYNFVTINNNIINAGDGQIDTDEYYGAIDLYECNHCVISNNHISQNNDNGKSHGVVLRSSSNNIITGNNISKYTYGIGHQYNYNSNYNTISNNHIHNNNIGIYFRESKYNKILNNKIEYNEWYGIYLEWTRHNTISGNIISNNGNNDQYTGGILIATNYVSSNIISYNTISYNKPTGIYLTFANKDIITCNNFINNYGESGFPKRWWGHAFFENFILVDGLFTNYWEKNYWSDLRGNIKIIKGRILTPFFFYFIWINFDFNPAKEPYNITSAQGCGIE